MTNAGTLPPLAARPCCRVDLAPLAQRICAIDEALYECPRCGAYFVRRRDASLREVAGDEAQAFEAMAWGPSGVF